MFYKFTNRLLHYAAFSASFLILNRGKAQTVYHEYDPYMPLNTGDDFYLDIDSDGSIEFGFNFSRITVSSSSLSSGHEEFNFHASPFDNNQFIQTALDSVIFTSSSLSLSCVLPATNGVVKLEENALINEFANWGQPLVMEIVDRCGIYGAYGEQGLWFLTGDTRDYFVGFRFYNPDMHYGWIRLRHDDENNVDFIKDFGYENNEEVAITSPDVYNHIAPSAENLELFTDGLSNALILYFDEAEDEDKLQEYRVILRKTTDAGEFTAMHCEITNPENYISVNKTGGPYAVNLSTLETDWKGNLLVEGQSYKAYVYSKFIYPVSLFNGLSEASNDQEYNPLIISGVLSNDFKDIDIFYSEGNIYINTDNTEIQHINIFDISGRNIRQHLIGENINNNFQFPFVMIPGMYLIQLHTTEGIFTQPLLIK